MVPAGGVGVRLLLGAVVVTGTVATVLAGAVLAAVAWVNG